MRRLAGVLVFALISVGAFSSPDSDSIGFRVVREVLIQGNKKTKDFIILRELTFVSGDTIATTDLADRVERSRQNLMNTALFNFVDAKITYPDAGGVSIRIEVVERWYFWPNPIFEIAETNFNTWWLRKDPDRLNYGTYLVKDNVGGRRESLRFKFQWGFTQNIGIQYLMPFVNRKRTIGLSYTFAYSRNHEVNTGTSHNKRMFYKDPTRFVKQEYFTRISTTYRPELNVTHTVDLELVHAGVADTVLRVSPGYFKNNATTTSYAGIAYHFRHDTRDYASYPLTGKLLSFSAVKYGFGTATENHLNLLTAHLRYTHHIPLGGRLYAGAGFFGKTTLVGAPPYFYQRGLGYGDYVRGYEYYVIDGQHHLLAKGNLKVQLLRTGKKQIDLLKTEKFNTFFLAIYLNFYGDVGYVWDDYYAAENGLSNDVMAGGGVGLDFLTYYDWVLRLEGSVNRMQEPGFYVHFVKAF